MSNKRKWLIAAALTMLTGSSLADPAKMRIVVRATAFKGTKGQALVALYNSSDNWLKIDKAVRLTKVPITGDTVEVTFEGLEPGIYAASAIHDENTNGKLDMRYFPIPGPVEGAGVSRDATATFGPPSWNDAKIRIAEGGGLIAFKIRY